MSTLDDDTRARQQRRRATIAWAVGALIVGGIVGAALGAGGGGKASAKTVTVAHRVVRTVRAAPPAVRTVTVVRSHTIVKTRTRTVKAAPPAARTFSGNGGETLAPITLPSATTLAWINDGALFQIFDAGGVPVNSRAHSGQTFIAAGKHAFQINAVGSWTVKLMQP